MVEISPNTRIPILSALAILKHSLIIFLQTLYLLEKSNILFKILPCKRYFSDPYSHMSVIVIRFLNNNIKMTTPRDLKLSSYVFVCAYIMKSIYLAKPDPYKE